MIEKLVGYVTKEFKRGRDLELLIKTQEDDFEKATLSVTKMRKTEAN